MQTEEQMSKENGMSVEEAIRILHPDTTLDASTEIGYYAGFKCEEAQIKAVEQACLIACEALEKQIPMRPMHSGIEYDCPRCLETVGYVTKRNRLITNHHCKCGQRIDWSDYE